MDVHPAEHPVFVGNSEMAHLMRSKDWSATPLGPVESWPEALRTALRILLTSRFEMWLGWGPDIAFFYNDAYRPTLGRKHPDALAVPARELWKEIWADVEGRMRAVYDHGASTWDRGLRLLVERNGYREESFHTFSYSPLIGDDGAVHGLFCVVTEETERVLSERRMESLRVLASSLAGASSVADIGAATVVALADNAFDLPFALVYRFAGARAERLIALGFDAAHAHAHAPEWIERGSPGPWPLDADGASVVLDADAGLPRGPWDAAVERAVVVHIPGQGGDEALGALVVGLNPHRIYDADYAAYLTLIANQLSSAYASAQAHDTARRRADALAEAARLREEAAQALRGLNARLASEVALRTAERDRMKQLFRQAPGFLCVLRGADHVFEFMNESYAQLVGNRQDVLGRPVRDALPEIRGQGFYELLDEVYASGRPFIGRGMPVELQRRTDAPLERRYLHFIYQPIVEDDGHVSGIFVEGHDVTDEVHAESALRQLNETLERQVRERTQERDMVWRTSRDLLVICTLDGRCVSANPGWSESLGHAGTHIVGQPFEAFLHPDDVGLARQRLQTLRDGHIVRDLDVRVRDRNGQHRWFSWTCVPEGEAFCAAGRELTDRLQLEEQLRRSQKLESLGKLTGGIAHDFNNLLQIISGNLQLLERHVVGNQAAEARIAAAAQGVARASQLASRLLAFGRRQALEPRVLQLAEFVGLLEDMLQRVIGEEIELSTELDADSGNTQVDPGQVENALLNLVINARDAMNGRGRLRIRVFAASLESADVAALDEVRAGPYVVLEVADDGCGMASDIAERVFEPFFSTKPEGAGSGLGLSMVYGFVKQSGGHVRLDTAPGAGTRVSLFLPRIDAPAEPPRRAIGGRVVGGVERILVVEDEPAVRSTVVALLGELGYRVSEAASADEALARLQSGLSVDLLFTDVSMPGRLRSPELADAARRLLPNLAVLFTSGYAQDEIVHDGRLDAGVDLLPKPYDREALARRVRAVLDGARPPVPDAPDRPLRVLLVEDDVAVRLATAAMLGELGHEADAVGNGEQALRRLERMPYDVVLLDLHLPDVSGHQLAERLAALRPELRIVFVSGDVAPDLAEGLRWLAKPFTQQQLATALASAEPVGAASSAL